MIDANTIIPIIIGIHILGTISGYVIIGILSRKQIFPNNVFWNDLQVVGGVLWSMFGMLSPFIIWFNYRIDKKKGK